MTNAGDEPKPWRAPASLGEVFRARAVEWRHTWWFRHAHHPLCGRYSPDVLTLGKLELCRSCTFVYVTLIAATPLLFLGRAPDLESWPWAFGALAIVTALASCPPLYRWLPRLLKDGARLLLGLLIAAWIASAFSGHFLLALGSLPALILLHHVYGRLRQGPESRARCETCPEFRGGSICSGFSRQAEAHRTLEEIWSLKKMARTQAPEPQSELERTEPER